MVGSFARVALFTVGLLGVALVAAPRDAAAAVGLFGLSSPANGAYVNATPTLRWTASTGATSYTLTVTPISGAPLVKTGLTATSYTIAAGEILSEAGSPYTWRVRATDGTIAMDSSTSSFFVDTTPPSAFGLTAPAAGAFVRGSDSAFTWAAATDSGSGIAKYHFYVDGALCGDVAGAYFHFFPDTCNPTDGPHIWAVSAEDVAGNIRWCNEAPGGVGGRAFITDNTGPTIAGGGTFQLASANTPDQLNFPSDRMVNTGINVLPGDQISITSTGTWCFLGCSSGCVDTNGRVNQVNLPAPGCNNGSLIARVGGGSLFKCIGTSATFTAGSNDTGILELGANAQPTAGCGSPTVTAMVTGGRGFGLVSPGDGAVMNQQFPTFSWLAAGDPGSGGVTYLLNIDGVPTGATNTNLGTILTATTYTIPDRLGDGFHSWYVRARDAVGNITDSATRSFIVDTTKPDQFRLRMPGMNACSSTPTPNLCWNVVTDPGGLGGYQLWIDGALAFSTDNQLITCATPSAALAPGMHTWYAVAIDRAGNARQSLETFNLLVDYTAPAAPAPVAPANGSSSADAPLFSWMAASDAGGVAHYEIYVDGNLAQTVDGKTLSWLVPSDLAGGMHTWYVRALDNCGQATPSATATFTIVGCTLDGGAAHRCPGYNVGPCTPGTRTCVSAGTWSACSGAVGPTTETCNGIDDNCNGVVDEGILGQTFVNTCGGVCQLPIYVYTPCDNVDTDACQEGVFMCDGLNGEVCVETTPVEVEVCNGRDDDCDGAIDNDCVGGPGPGSGAGGMSGVAGMSGAGGGGGISGAGGAGGMTGTGGGGAASGGRDGGSATTDGPSSAGDGAVHADAAASDARGAGGAGGHPSSPDSGADAGAERRRPSSSGCSCSTAAASRQPLACAGLLFAVALLFARRRRR
jgi:MYXO-CTERM domain-containing protein